MSNKLLSKSENYNPNYLASISKATNIRPHPNADKLNLGTVNGSTVIIGKDVKEGDIGVYFPLECIINHEFLSYCNLYRDRELNRDKEATPGFFEVKYENKAPYHPVPIGGRVKAIRLRGILSEGFWIEQLKFSDYLFSQKVYSQNEVLVGNEFDTIDGEWFVKKYTVQKQSSPSIGKNKQAAKVSLIVPEQFRFHIDTEQLARNLLQLNPNDLISITTKVHGTSAISSNLLVKDLSLKSRVLGIFGHKNYKYDNIYSSRRVIKNQWIGMNKGKGYYDEDIWKSADLTLQPYLEKGVSIYYEIVGYVGEKYIQKDFDYGCKPGEFQTYIYRITYTNVDGKVFEFSAKQVNLWAKEKGLNPVPELYYGYLCDLFPNMIDYDDRDWRSTFLQLLKDTYVEGKMCTICKNKVPAEGIVLRIDDSLYPKAFKLKNSEFLLRESKELDQGISSIEEEN